jgi:hypothetical protein
MEIYNFQGFETKNKTKDREGKMRLASNMILWIFLSISVASVMAQNIKSSSHHILILCIINSHC